MMVMSVANTNVNQRVCVQRSNERDDETGAAFLPPSTVVFLECWLGVDDTAE